MRVLIVGLVPTHVMTMVPLAWALRAAGHEVLVSAPAPVVERAAGAGVSGAAVNPPPGRKLGRSAPPSGPAATGQAGAGPDWALMEERWRQRVDGVLDEHLATARAWRPDLVLCDPIEFSGLIVAAALGVPAVVHRWGPDEVGSRTVPRAVAALAETAARHGVPDGPVHPALILDPCPPSLQCADAAPAQPVRYVPFNGAGPLPSWVKRLGPAARRVCVSFGSDSPLLTAPGVWDDLMHGLTSVPDLEAIVTAAPGDGVTVPPGVLTPGPVPLDLFLGSCTALMHHGGAGTALTGLAFGLPQLVPLPSEPNPTWTVVGRRLTERGAGLMPDLHGRGAPEPPAGGYDPKAVRTALEELLTTSSYGETAQELAQEIREQPTPTALVPLLTELAANPPAPVTGPAAPPATAPTPPTTH
ncbi:nucleotide disphospho-sugar-binding domain-containing protein [Streptomyces sp. NPDC057257]|uniref:nucleotide disphospho-sugar-binding domain-containing protein n=1 Tax=Streptomyces sp. NPDC057257 TaxID=3346071 RepID=UPI00363D58E3